MVFKKLISVFIAIIPFIFILQARADDAPASPKIFKKSNEVTSQAKENNKLIHFGKFARGFSYALNFNSRKKAFDEALSNAITAGFTSVYEVSNQDVNYDPAPPGSYMPGLYSVATLLEITFLDINPENLIIELTNGLQNSLQNGNGGYESNKFGTDYVKSLFELAAKPEHKGLSGKYKEIIRANNSDHGRSTLSQQLGELTDIIVLQEGNDCANDLIRWAKFHKDNGVRLSAYLNLVKLGKVSEIEEMLKTEVNPEIKDTVQKNLI
jgi:hypothetical protein